MIPKYHIEYSVQFSKHAQPSHYQTDDPVAAEEFLVELLTKGFHVREIRHDGVELPRIEFDKMIKSAAGMLAARRICNSLGINSEEEHHRFGFAV